MLDAFEAKLEISQKRRADLAALRDLPAVTRDGVTIELMINAGLREDIAALDLTGARGIGLFRTEFQFLVSATLPQRERQQRLYRDVLDAAGRSEEHTSELQSLMRISYAVFCLKKKQHTHISYLNYS